jgi:hypothetical protein
MVIKTGKSGQIFENKAKFSKNIKFFNNKAKHFKNSISGSSKLK